MLLGCRTGDDGKTIGSGKIDDVLVIEVGWVTRLLMSEERVEY